MGKLKKAIYENLSYTSQDYETILADIISTFQEGAIDSVWNNMSESDIMFILMHLMSAHKDILNYMLDYRILEGYMSTAKERASMVRIANSFGYKIPSYRAPYAVLKVSDLGGHSSADIESLTTFTDGAGNNWVYFGVDQGLSEGDEISVYQGVLYDINFSANNIDAVKKTHIISNENIAIGNNHDNLGVSKLFIDGEEWKEIPSIYTYSGEDQKVYELNVDPQGITYIRFLKTLNITDYEGDTFNLSYIITSGRNITGINTAEAILLDGSTEVEATFIVSTSTTPNFISGSDPASSQEIREGFNRFYASSNSLVTLEDYKNFILFEQKEVLGLTKCLVADKQRDTLDGDGDDELGNSQVVIYATKSDNDEPSNEERDLLIQELSKFKMTGLSLYVNGYSFDETEPESAPIKGLDIVAIDIEINILPDGLSDFITEYINKKGIGESLKSSELYSLILNSKYAPYFSQTGIDITMKVGSTDYKKEVAIDYNKVFNCSSVS